MLAGRFAQLISSSSVPANIFLPQHWYSRHGEQKYSLRYVHTVVNSSGARRRTATQCQGEREILKTSRGAFTDHQAQHQAQIETGDVDQESFENVLPLHVNNRRHDTRITGARKLRPGMTSSISKTIS